MHYDLIVNLDLGIIVSWVLKLIQEVCINAITAA